MPGTSNFKSVAVARTLLAASLLAPLGAALAVSDADFNHEVQVVNRQLQRPDIRVDPSVPARPPGAAGRAAGVAPEAPAVDTGSSQFDSYVNQLNQELRIRHQAIDGFSSGAEAG